MIAEVTDAINRHGSVIVLEDDLDLASPFFLRFMEDGLTRYRDEVRVMEISGYTIRSEMFLHVRMERAGLQRYFDLEGTARFIQMLRDSARGQLGGWDVRWSAAMLLNQGLTLCPPTSLTNNIGHDGSGTNCLAGSDYDGTLSQTPVSDFPIVIVEDAEFHQALRRFFVDMVGTVGSILHRPPL